MVVWKDESTYSQGYKNLIPHCFFARVGKFRLSVYSHRISPGKWFSDCHGFWNMREMASDKLEEAQCQTVAGLQVMLEDAIKEIVNGCFNSTTN